MSTDEPGPEELLIPPAGAAEGAFEATSEAEEQGQADQISRSADEEPWVRYGVEHALNVELAHNGLVDQAKLVADRLETSNILVAIGRDCGGPVHDVGCAAGFARGRQQPNAFVDVFTLRLDDSSSEDDELQRPQKLEDFDEILRVLPSAGRTTNAGTRCLLCVEVSLDEPPGLIRTLMSNRDTVAKLDKFLSPGQQIVFTVELKAQERIPSAALTNRQEIVLLNWVEPLLRYYNENWEFDEHIISRAIRDISSTLKDRPERESALYSAIFALARDIFPKGSADFEESIQAAIAESEKTVEAIAQLGLCFSSGNKIEQIVLALAAFGPAMSHRTFSLLGALFLPDEPVPLAFLPEQVARVAEEGASARHRPTWVDVWRSNLDFYRNKLRVAKSRNQEIELRLNREYLREHLLQVYPAALEQILDAIPGVVRASRADRDVEEGAIRLLVRIAVTDSKSYDRSWFVNSIFDIAAREPNLHYNVTVARILTALRALDEQTALDRPGFAGAVFEDLIRALRRQDFSVVAISDLCKRLDADRFRTLAVLEGLLHNAKFVEFRELLDNLGLTQGRLTSTQRLNLMLSFVRSLAVVDAYRRNTADHAARRALWIWHAGLRAERFPLSVPYQRIFLHRTLARELFLSGSETAGRLIRGVLAFDPRALVFGGRNRRDLRRWLETIAFVTLRAVDADAAGFVLACEGELLQQVSYCLLKTLHGPRARGSTALSAFDELEPLELWRDAYTEIAASHPNPRMVETAERLLLLPLVARSALFAEWILQSYYSAHAIPTDQITSIVDSAVDLLRTVADRAAALKLADDFAYLAGIVEQVAKWVEQEKGNCRVARMYAEKKTILERVASRLRSEP
jgi:nuclear transport factor 2 (NTF2) superfamily protein